MEVRLYEFGAGLGIENFFYHIDINTLKAIKVNDNVADHILNEASFRGVDKAKFHHIVSSFNR